MTETRDTFLARLHAPTAHVVFSSDEINRIELCYDLSKNVHRPQARMDGTRYFEHPRRVMLILFDELEFYDAEATMAAILHDALEDGARYVSAEKIAIVAGERVSKMVRLLSKIPKEGYVERLAAHGDWKTLLVKACDRLDNLRDLPAGNEIDDVMFRRKQYFETLNTYAPMFVRMTEIAPKDHQERCRKASSLIQKCMDTLAPHLHPDILLPSS